MLKSSRLFTALATSALLCVGSFSLSAQAEDIVLRMAVPDWPPTRIMKDLADKHYKAPSGNKVTLEPGFYSMAELLRTTGCIADVWREKIQYGGL